MRKIKLFWQTEKVTKRKVLINKFKLKTCLVLNNNNNNLNQDYRRSELKSFDCNVRAMRGLIWGR